MNELTQVKDTDNLLDELGISGVGMAPGLALMFNERLYDKCTQLAKVMAAAQGTTPKHLLGKPEACFAVITRAITWRLDPFAVAMSTYQTPGGAIGFEGKLIQAILENSGKIEGNVKYKHYGDWSQVKGKFELKKGQSGKDYPMPSWTREDAKGLGVTVVAQVIGEVEPREMDFDLDECFPLNSTLWATRPKQQICYTACRAFANTVTPGLLMGVPFDGDSPMSEMRDVTPPQRPAFTETPAESVEDVVTIDDARPADWAVEIGYEAFKAGVTMKDAPDHLNSTDYANWCDGWEKAQAEAEPSKAEKIAPGDKPGAVAYREGWAAFEAGKSLMSNEKSYDGNLLESYKDGWRDAEADKEIKK